MKVKDVQDQLSNLFSSTLEQSTQNLNDTDLIRVIIHSDTLTTPIFVPLQKVGGMTSEVIMDHINHVLTSHEGMPLDGSFYVDIGTIEVPSGGRGRAIQHLTGPYCSGARKRSILKINNQDNTCMALAIAMAFVKANTVPTQEWHGLINEDDDDCTEKLIWKHKKAPNWYYSMLRFRNDHLDRQTKLTHELCRLTGTPTNRPLALSDIDAFEQFLNVDILVIRAVGGNKFIKTPPEGIQKQRLYLHLVEDPDKKKLLILMLL
ncbi:uncharacterized protein LOC133198782 [Saccostrea echinata]|uniref:uncharacterized protein LOC133198782 n=1 Tax=Saccostrea echinata TaxID=191078 RepID=UPI002A824404|nr:uncharacterized protein LOC133198782 [Saccostrea echinata]